MLPHLKTPKNAFLIIICCFAFCKNILISRYLACFALKQSMTYMYDTHIFILLTINSELAVHLMACVYWIIVIVYCDVLYCNALYCTEHCVVSFKCWWVSASLLVMLVLSNGIIHQLDIQYRRIRAGGERRGPGYRGDTGDQQNTCHLSCDNFKWKIF